MDGGCKCQVAKYTPLSFPFRSSLSSRLVSRDLPYLVFFPFVRIAHLYMYRSPSRFVPTMPPAFDKYALAECVRSLARRETTRKDQAAANKFLCMLWSLSSTNERTNERTEVDKTREGLKIVH